MSAWWRISLSEIADSYLIELRNFFDEQEHDAMNMGEIDIQDYARQLLEAHGDKAVAEAAQKASTSAKGRQDRRSRNLEAH
jgi:hypothetical protein